MENVIADECSQCRSKKKTGNYNIAATGSAEEKQIALEYVENPNVENADEAPMTKEEEALAAVNPLAAVYMEGEMSEVVAGKDEVAAVPEAEKETPLVV